MFRFNATAYSFLFLLHDLPHHDSWIVRILARVAEAVLTAADTLSVPGG